VLGNTTILAETAGDADVHGLHQSLSAASVNNAQQQQQQQQQNSSGRLTHFILESEVSGSKFRLVIGVLNCYFNQAFLEDQVVVGVAVVVVAERRTHGV
jgi:hypothetical protein